MQFEKVVVGIPKETLSGERRVAATPEIVEKMIKGGATVWVESGAGTGSLFSDAAYEAAGAKVTSSVEELYGAAQVILKVKEPRHDDERQRHEAELLQPGQWLIAFLHPAAPANHEMVRLLAKREAVALTLDGIPRITRAQSMDALTSMSTVAGYKSVLMAASDLATFVPMIGTAVGATRPAQTLVVGAGVAGLQALATAKRLGAVTQAADIRPDACEQAKSLGAKIVDVGVPPELATGEGGYARHLPDEWLLREQEALAPVVRDASIVILAALVPGKRAPMLLTEEMVASMRPGSVIVDIAIDQGGNCALTERGQIIEKHGVSIHGIQNLPGTVPAAATWLFANNVYNFLAYLCEDNGLVLNMEDDIVRSALVTRDGDIVHAGYLEAVAELKEE